MSELKERMLGQTMSSYGCDTKIYLKSEADKVIAELKRQIEFLKVTANSCKNCAQCADGMGKVFDKEFNPLKDKLRREKYKRCLSMARWCHNQREIYERDSYNWELEDDAVNSLRNKANIMRKWRKRWLAIAEKFKDIELEIDK